MGISHARHYNFYDDEEKDDSDQTTERQRSIMRDMVDVIIRDEKDTRVLVQLMDALVQLMEALDFNHIFNSPDLRFMLAIVIWNAQTKADGIGACVMVRLQWLLPPNCFNGQHCVRTVYTVDEICAYMFDDPQSNYCKLFPYGLVGDLVRAHSDDWSPQMTNCIAALCFSTYAPALNMDAVIQWTASFLSEVARTAGESGSNEDIIKILHEYAISNPSYSWLGDLHTTENFQREDVPQIFHQIINDIPVNMRALLTLDDRHRRLRSEFFDDRKGNRHGWQFDHGANIDRMQGCIDHLRGRVMKKLCQVRDDNKLNGTLETWERMLAEVREKEEKAEPVAGEAMHNFDRESLIGSTVYNTCIAPANTRLENEWAVHAMMYNLRHDAPRGLMYHRFIETTLPLGKEAANDPVERDLLYNAVYIAEREILREVDVAASAMLDITRAIRKSDDVRRKYYKASEAEMAHQGDIDMYESAYKELLDKLIHQLTL
jgi:hypothetical protein